jgi:tetratricopeptide (TPR) repeat protein
MLRNSRLERSLATATLLAALTLVGCGGGAASVEKKPVENDAMNQMRMADSLMNAGRVGESLATIQAAIDADPRSAPLRLQHGQLCFRAGLYPDAEAAFEAALAIDPHMTDAHNFLGTVYHELGRHDDAEAQYRIALQDLAYPNPEMVYLNLGLLYGDLGRDEEAIESLRQAVGLNPRYYKGHYYLAAALERVGNFDEAAREYDVAEPGFRQNGEYFYRRGFAYFRLGQKHEARESLIRVLDVAPGSESAAQADELLKMMSEQ